MPTKKGTRGRKKKGRKRGPKSEPPSSPPTQLPAISGGLKSELQSELQSSPHPSFSELPATPPKSATPPSERLVSRKRKRRDTCSPSPGDTSLCAPRFVKQPKLDPDVEPVTTASAKPDTPPFSPPSSTERLSDPNPKRKRNSTFVILSNNISLVSVRESESSSGTPADEMSPKPTVNRKRKITYTKDGSDEDGSSTSVKNLDSQDSQPLTKKARRSTYEVPSHESSLVNNSAVIDSGLDESGEAMELYPALVGGASMCGDDCSDAKEELLNLLDKRVEERSEWVGLVVYSQDIVMRV